MLSTSWFSTWHSNLTRSGNRIHSHDAKGVWSPNGDLFCSALFPVMFAVSSALGNSYVGSSDTGARLPLSGAGQIPNPRLSPRTFLTHAVLAELDRLKFDRCVILLDLLQHATGIHATEVVGMINPNYDSRSRLLRQTAVPPSCDNACRVIRFVLKISGRTWLDRMVSQRQPSQRSKQAVCFKKTSTLREL